MLKRAGARLSTPGAETNTVAKDLLPDSLMGHDVLVIRVEGTLNFTAASSLRHTFFFFQAAPNTLRLKLSNIP